VKAPPSFGGRTKGKPSTYPPSRPAGYCLVASGHHDGDRLIVVIPGATSNENRYRDARTSSAGPGASAPAPPRAAS